MQRDFGSPPAIIEGDFLPARDIRRSRLSLKPVLAICLAVVILAIATQQVWLLAIGLVFTAIVWSAWRLGKSQRVIRLKMDESALSIAGHGYDVRLEAPFRFKTGVQRIPPTGTEDETCFVRIVIDVRGKPLVLEEQVLSGRMPPKLDDIPGDSSALGIAELSSCTPHPGTLWSVIQRLEALALNQDTEQLDRNIVTLFELGKRQMAEKSYSQAIDTFSAIIRLSPDSSPAYYNRGAARYFNRSELDKAANDLSTSLRLEPDQYKCYRMRGLIHAQLGEWVAMRDDCTKAIQLLPDSAELYNLRGSACYRLLDYASALENFDQSIRLDGGRYEAYYNRGLAKQKMALLNEALFDFRYALQLNPGFDSARRGFNYVESRLRQLNAPPGAATTGERMSKSGHLTLDDTHRRSRAR